MEWRVVENVKDINVEDELTLNYLNSDFVSIHLWHQKHLEECSYYSF